MLTNIHQEQQQYDTRNQTEPSGQLSEQQLLEEIRHKLITFT